jgi:hypothetical protein
MCYVDMYKITRGVQKKYALVPNYYPEICGCHFFFFAL